MSSPTEEEEKIPTDFIHCVQKLLSSISTLSKHLSILTSQKETTGQNEELTIKLQVSKRKKKQKHQFNNSKNQIFIFIVMKDRILTLIIFLINLKP